ncbi:DMT family transporter [Defluviimonas sp. D31]|uniref:DMT family transporter n=1 Tax=Defluviimonas sp. D31 TaxID=3083253 RepID=UPI00296F6681|nr:DMT family transporter [Defluviimonas sp. D31]MDW4549691.1 DMT family transporter [Defluviimonas sp. D31]
MSSNARGAILALAAMGVFATHDVVIKYLGGFYAPFQTVFFAALLSFPVLTVALLTDAEADNLRPRHKGWNAVRTVLSVITSASAFYAFATLPLAQVYAILFSAPLVITILAIPMLGEKVRARRWAAVVVGLAGVMIVLRPGQSELTLGHAAALIAALANSIASIIVRKVGKDERSIVLLMYPLIGSFVAMGLALPFVYVPMPVTHLGLMAVISVFGIGASWLLILAYRAAEAVVVAPMQYSQIIWATGYGYLLFDERLDSATVIGAAIIIGSGLYIVFRESRTGASRHKPVLETRGRDEAVTTLRPGLLQRLILARRKRAG